MWQSMDCCLQHICYSCLHLCFPPRYQAAGWALTWPAGWPEPSRVLYSRCIRLCCQLFSIAEHGRRPQLYIYTMLHEFMNCCVATTGHRVTSCEVPLLKLQLEGSCNLQLEPEKHLVLTADISMLSFFLGTCTTVDTVWKKITLFAWTHSFPFVRAWWEN